ncbi:CHAT domain-containing protein [candidate division KSB1 bacterium]|nr:CHAT domain-containing protein [candidate division KSB1 bacterium]
MQLIVLFLVSACFFLNSCSQKTDLFDLQRIIYSSTSAQDTLKIVQQLEQYYKSLPVPHSISLQVVTEFRRQQQNFQLPKMLDIPKKLLPADIFLLEKKLQEIIQAAILAMVRQEALTTDELIGYARRLAYSIDNLKENQYWQKWLDDIQKFNFNQAQNWCQAQIAANYCYEYHNNTDGYQKAELFGALALQRLASFNDRRLQLDVWQRIQLILYKFKGLYGLSFALAHDKIKAAKAIGYSLREIGLTYNLANALGHVGQDQVVIKKLNALLQEVQKYPTVPEMISYKKLICFCLGSAYWQTGDYLKALQICKEIEKETLQTSEKIELTICECLNYHELGEYERVEQLYKSALKLAYADQDYSNLMVIYHNLSDYYSQFRLYKKSLLYCDSALQILVQKNGQNFANKCIYLQSKTNILLRLNRQDEVKQINQEIEKLLEESNIPLSKAESFRLIARTNFQLKNYEAALSNFTKAFQIYHELFLTRPAVETQINLIKTFIQLSRLEEAGKLLNEVKSKNEKMKDEFIQIDVNGLYAEIAFKKNNLRDAIYHSNLVLSQVRNRFQSIQSLENFAAFRQRVYHYLKSAAIYEIYADHPDSAFFKLDFAKNSYAAMKLNSSQLIPSKFTQPTKGTTINFIQKQLKPAQLLINFLISENELHVFALTNDNLKLFSKSISAEKFQAATDKYIEVILNTSDIIQRNEKEKLLENFQLARLWGNNLYQFLFNWPELEHLIEHSEITYVIPDEKLYHIPLATLPLMRNDRSQFLINKTGIINLPCSAAILGAENQYNTLKRSFKIKYCADLNFKKAAELVRVIKSVFHDAEELSFQKDGHQKSDILAQLNQGIDIFIFCGHGTSNTGNPDLSTLSLAILDTTTSKREIVQLTLNDLKTIDWSSAKLVILLGCETAGKDELHGTGLEGFQQVVSSRGAQNVIASLWKIEENQGISQIKSFLQSWTETQDIAVAFHKMQLLAIQNLENHKLFQRPHPFLWGAFTLAQATTPIE